MARGRVAERSGPVGGPGGAWWKWGGLSPLALVASPTLSRANTPHLSQGAKKKKRPATKAAAPTEDDGSGESAGGGGLGGLVAYGSGSSDDEK